MDWIRDSIAGISWLIAHSGTAAAAAAADVDEDEDTPLVELLLRPDEDWEEQVVPMD